jgi:hypothetical protein
MVAIFLTFLNTATTVTFSGMDPLGEGEHPVLRDTTTPDVIPLRTATKA